MARPTKLTPDLETRILTFLRAGNYVIVAAQAAGINRDTIFHWLRRGAKDRADKKRTIYSAFSVSVEKAMAEGEAMDVARIAKAAAAGQWQASAWRLERRFPERWSRNNRAIEKLQIKKLKAEIRALDRRDKAIEAGESGETIRVEVWGKGGLPPKAEP